MAKALLSLPLNMWFIVFVILNLISITDRVNYFLIIDFPTYITNLQILTVNWDSHTKLFPIFHWKSIPKKKSFWEIQLS